MKRINLKKEIKYSICTCGASKTMPFCDSSHRELNEKFKCNYGSLKIIPESDITLNLSSNTWQDESENSNKAI